MTARGRELLIGARDIVLAEPARVNMKVGLSTYPFIQEENITSHTHEPPCGTVGCIAGWIWAQLRPYERPNPVVFWDQISPVVQDALGLEVVSWDGLVFDSDWPPAIRLELVCEIPGTPEYAAVVARRIDQVLEQEP